MTTQPTLEHLRDARNRWAHFDTIDAAQLSCSLGSRNFRFVGFLVACFLWLELHRHLQVRLHITSLVSSVLIWSQLGSQSLQGN